LNDIADKDLAQFRTARLIAWAMLAAAPLIYLIIMSFVKVPVRTGGEVNLMLYILLSVSLVQPALAYVIEKRQIASFTKGKQPLMGAGQMYMTIMITRLAMVEAVFIYGVVVYMLSGSILNALYFYPVGIIWSIVHWPRRDAFEQFLKRVEGHEHRA
jgi:hypothetical protein